MKRLTLLVAITLAGLFVLGNTPAMAMAYDIDGKLDDWGINLFATGADEKGYLDKDENLPSGGLDIDYITDDDAEKCSNWTHVGPGWSYQNYFDAEAIYFDNDLNYAYIAIVQGLPITGGTAPHNPWFLPGDIAIDVGSDGSYEYGLNISDSTLYYGCKWLDAVYTWSDPDYNPWAIDEKNLGTEHWGVDFAYSTEQNTHYVLEAAIPLSYLDLEAGDDLTIHWTMECGNDYLNLTADVNPVPEPITLILLGSGLLGLGAIRKKRL